MQEPIYLDYASTTPVDQRVLDQMLPFFKTYFGNASSRSHQMGWHAKLSIEKATNQVAKLINCPAESIVYTSGSTEALNLAIKGYLRKLGLKTGHLVCSAVEHHAVLDCFEDLEKNGFRVSYISPNLQGEISVERVGEAIEPDTVLAAVMFINNETGVINPILEIQELCKEQKVALVCDATQAVGKHHIDVQEAQIDMLAFSAHKFYGPKGVGALYVKPSIRLNPEILGGGHQQNRRSGTLNVPGIVGMGAAAEICMNELNVEASRISRLRENLESQLQLALDQMIINGKGAKRLPHILNVSFRFIEAEALLSKINRKLALSTGSACSSETLEPSHVLQAMGLSYEDTKAAIRLSIGRLTTEEDLKTAAQILIQGVNALRAESPTWELYQDGVLN